MPTGLFKAPLKLRDLVILLGLSLRALSVGSVLGTFLALTPVGLRTLSLATSLIFLAFFLFLGATRFLALSFFLRAKLLFGLANFFFRLAGVSQSP